MAALSLTTIILIAIGGLVFIAVIFWQLKECIEKRRKRIKVNDAVPMDDRQTLEKNLAGRMPPPRRQAYTHGSFSSSTRGTPSSPAPAYTPAPNAGLIDWGQPRKGIPAPSIRSLSQQDSVRKMSVSSVTTPMPVRHKPSPLRPDDYRTFSASTIGGIGGTYMPPLPSPRSIRCGTPDSHRSGAVSGAWVAPLDVHFSRPSTPNSISRPPSFLPKLQFPGEIEQSALLIPTPGGSAPNSEVASIVNSDSSSNPPGQAKRANPPVEIPHTKAPSFSMFPATGLPPRTDSNSARSIFPVGGGPQRPPSRRRPSDIDTQKANGPVPPIPQNSQAFEPPNFDFGTLEGPKRSPIAAILRDSVVSKRRVSVYRPPKTPRSREASPDVGKGRIASAHSVAASSMYSTTTSILNTPGDATFASQIKQMRPRSGDEQRDRSRSSSSHRIRRAPDSLRRHSRRLSQSKDGGKTLEKDSSRERDALHYDPRQHHRDHSGSVHGRRVDFDHPRESPFSNIHATSDHSTSTSVSTTVSTVPSRSPQLEPRGRPIARDWDWEKVPELPKLDLHLPPPGIHHHPEQDHSRLSVNPAMPGAHHRFSNASRNRSASEVSQSSIGDFYDAYYRQSVMAQRASLAAQNQSGAGRSPAGDLMLGAGAGSGAGDSGPFAGFNFGQDTMGSAPLGAHARNGSWNEGGNANGSALAGAGKRIQPLNFSRGGLAAQTIIEVHSPMASPVGMNGNGFGNVTGDQRFPSRI